MTGIVRRVAVPPERRREIGTGELAVAIAACGGAVLAVRGMELGGP